MKRLAIAVVACVTVVGCAQLSALTKSASNKVQASVPKVQLPGADLVQFKADAEKKCDPILNFEVTPKEEHEMGGAIALSLGEQTKGIFIEEAVELAGKPIDVKKMAELKVTAPKGQKTDVTLSVARVGRYLAQNSSRPNLNWTFIVLEDPSINAFSAPGGYVFATTGLLKTVDNEAQLAGVLGHEIGHVTEKHSLTSYKRGKRNACVLAVVAAAVLKKAPSIELKELASLTNTPSLNNFSKKNIEDFANELLDVASGNPFNPMENTSPSVKQLVMFLTDVVVALIKDEGFGKEAEFKSDAIAAELMASSGYDVKEFQKLLGKLSIGDGTSPHPSNKDRIAKIDTLKGELMIGVESTPPKATVLSAMK